MILPILLIVTVLFAALLFIKSKFSLKFCVICLSVSVTWLSLLALYHSGRFSNQFIVALLMGQSITGIYYLMENKLSGNALVFRLPILLTLTYGFYVSLTLTLQLTAGLMVAGIWLIFYLAYLYRANGKISGSFKKIIECCSKW